MGPLWAWWWRADEDANPRSGVSGGSGQGLLPPEAESPGPCPAPSQTPFPRLPIAQFGDRCGVAPLALSPNGPCASLLLPQPPARPRAALSLCSPLSPKCPPRTEDRLSREGGRETRAPRGWEGGNEVCALLGALTPRPPKPSQGSVLLSPCAPRTSALHALPPTHPPLPAAPGWGAALTWAGSGP